MYNINPHVNEKNTKIGTQSRSHLIGKVRDYFAGDLGELEMENLRRE